VDVEEFERSSQGGVPDDARDLFFLLAVLNGAWQPKAANRA
jgi:hypothetical protein